MPVEDLEWALREQRAKKRQARYKLARKYYEGDHRLAFAIERFRTVFGERLEEIADNLCPTVVDSVTDRLKIVGFSSTATQRRNGVVTDPNAAKAWAIWRRNRMGQRAAEIHRDSLITGDGYCIVWPTDSAGAAIWPQKPEEMVIQYSETVPGDVDRAGRVWLLRDGRLRVNVYFPDRIEKWVAERKGTSTSHKQFVPLAGEEIVPHPFGRVPVFHFPNKRLFENGVSHLKDVIPLQDALNKAVCDMLVAMEYASFRQRWATGLGDEFPDDEDGAEDEDDRPKEPPFRPGIERVWALMDKDAKFGEFDETNLEQFLRVQEDLRAEVARVSGTPLHLLFITRGDFPSGEAMKSAEARFTELLEEQQESKGNSWEDALTFALRIEGARIPASFELSATWKDAAPRSDEERARTAVVKKAAGVSRRQRLRELEYDDETIEQMIEDEPQEEPAALPADLPA